MEYKLTWEEAKEVVIPRYSFAPYIENLNEIPHKLLADIAIRYIVPVDEDDTGIAYYVVTNEIMGDWGITAEELDRVATENAKQSYVPIFGAIENVLFGGGGTETVSQLAPGSLDHFRLYVLTSQGMKLGSIVIGNPNTLEMISNGFGCDYYILPSSIHEVLVISVNHPGNAEGFAKMVREVNATEVSHDEKLSDNLFVYSAENKTLTKWEGDSGDVSPLPELNIDDLF